MQHKRERDVVQRIAEALEDGDEILESYHRIQAYLERLTVSVLFIYSLTWQSLKML